MWPCGGRPGRPQGLYIEHGPITPKEGQGGASRVRDTGVDGLKRKTSDGGNVGRLIYPLEMLKEQVYLVEMWERDVYLLEMWVGYVHRPTGNLGT